MGNVGWLLGRREQGSGFSADILVGYLGSTCFSMPQSCISSLTRLVLCYSYVFD